MLIARGFLVLLDLPACSGGDGRTRTGHLFARGNSFGIQSELSDSPRHLNGSVSPCLGRSDTAPEIILVLLIILVF